LSGKKAVYNMDDTAMLLAAQKAKRQGNRSQVAEQLSQHVGLKKQGPRHDAGRRLLAESLKSNNNAPTTRNNVKLLPALSKQDKAYLRSSAKQ